MGQILLFAPRVLRGYPTRTEALDRAEAALLLGLRCWVAEVRDGADPLPRVREALAAAGVAEAAPPLDMFLRVVARTAHRSIEMGCPHCPQVGPDEQALLHVARLAQGGATRQAEELLRSSLLNPVGASFAVGPLQGLGTLMARAGLRLPGRSLVEPAAPPPAIAEPWRPVEPANLH